MSKRATWSFFEGKRWVLGKLQEARTLVKDSHPITQPRMALRVCLKITTAQTCTQK
jgi:hypothetical protein